MKKRLRPSMTATVCMLAAVLAVGGTAQFGIAVVCVGSDGHIEVESVFDDCCSPAASHDEAGARSCGDCEDVRLKVPHWRTKETQLSSPSIVAEVHTILSHDSGCRNLPFRADHVEQNSKALSLLATVVLLT